MKKFKLFKMLAVLIVLITSSPQAKAWYVKGTFDEWTVHNMGGSNEYTYTNVTPGTYYYQFSKSESSNWSGADCVQNKTYWNAHKSLKESDFGLTSGQMTIKIPENSHVTIKYVGNGTNYNIDVFVRPAYYFKYDWNGGTWAWSGYLDRCGDGTYATEGKYRSTCTSFNYATEDKGSGTGDGSCSTIYTSGSPSGDANSFFIYDPDIANSGASRSLTIVEKNSTSGHNYMYFDNTNAGWGDANIQFVLGHLSYSRTLTMSKVGTSDYTNLYYVDRNGNDWTGDNSNLFGYFGMIGSATKWNDDSWNSNSMYNANHYSKPLFKHQNLQSGYIYMISKDNNTNGDPITIEEKTNSYTCLNFNLTIQYAISDNGGAYNPMSSGKTPATITGTSYNFTGLTTVASTTLTNAMTVNTTQYSTTLNSGYTGKTVLSVSNVRPGYKFVGWYDGNTLLSTNTTYNTYRPTQAKTITARFQKLYGYVEGRFKIKNQAGSSISVGGNGTWVKNSANIKMTYDETNDQFVLHTYSTPAELKNAFGTDDGYFFIKTSTSASTISSGTEDGPTEYWATSSTSSGNVLSDAGTKRAVSKTSTSLTFVGNSTSVDGYAIMYCNGTQIWYELEQTLQYAAGTGSGSAPASKAYYDKGTSVTVFANTFTAPDGYEFDYWSGSDGNNYKADDNVTLNSNITLTAQWKLKTYDISYSAGASGTGTLAGGTKTHGVTYALSSNSTAFTRDDYIYDGWATSDGGGKAYNLGGDYTTNAAQTFYPHWVRAYEVTHDLEHASTSTGATGVKAAVSGQNYVATFAAESPGYSLPSTITVMCGSTEITGNCTWVKGTGSLTIPSAYVTDDITISITGEPSTYDGTIGGVDGSDGTYRATYGSNMIQITSAPALAGHHVKQYYLYYLAGSYNWPIANKNNQLYNSAQDGTTTYTASDGKWNYTGVAPTIYVEWEVDSYILTLHENIPSGTTGEAGTGSVAVPYNTVGYDPEEITPPTADGYTFAGYYTAAEGGAQIYTNETPPGIRTNATDGVNTYTSALGKWIYEGDIDLYAHWTANEYTITLNDRSATSAVSPSSVKATFASKDLSASITNPAKWGSTFGGWAVNSNGTGKIVIGTDGKLVENVAGYTDVSGNWKHDGNVNLYAVWTPNEHLYWIPGDDDGAVDGDAEGAIEFTSAGDGKYYVTIDTDNNQVFHLGDGTNAAGPASPTNTYHTEFTLATSACGLSTNSYWFKQTGSKQTIVYVLDINTLQLSFENLVIYKPGDKSGDGHTAYGSVEGFIGTIYGQFEYRQRVDGINKWSTLYLPYKPTLVQAWGGTSYHNLYPCHRPEADDPLYQGYYVIRTPGQTTNLPIKDFKQWNDPTSYSSWTPEANTPYIIMWQLDWFRDKYISFWGNGGDAGVTFGSDFVPGDAPTADGVVNVLGNGTMVTGYVAGAYVLAEEYGDGAWLRGDKPKDLSTVGPFECYIRANAETTGKTLVIKRRTGEETPTGWEDVLNSERKAQVVVYTITGLRVTEYNDCSFDEAGRRLSETYNEGIFIMRAGDESVKLMLR